MTTSRNDEMKCFCWKEKRRKRRERRLSWEGGTAGHFGNQPPKKLNEPAASVPAVSPTGAIAVVTVVLLGKLDNDLVKTYSSITCIFKSSLTLRWQKRLSWVAFAQTGDIWSQ